MKTRMLSAIEVQTLVAAAAAGDAEAMNLLAYHFRPLIIRAAKRYLRVGYEEAVQEGYLALLEAVRQFEPAFGVPFTGFLNAKLRGDVRTAMRRLWRYEEHIDRASGGRDDGRFDAEVWDALQAGGRGARSGGVAGARSGSAASTPGSGYGPGLAGGVADAYELAEFYMVLEQVPLSSRERLAVAGMLRGESCADMAKQCGVSIDTVRTWRKRALRKLREALSAMK